MPITAKQAERRRDYIGSSDVPAILGVHPYKTAMEVWGEKTGKIDRSITSAAIVAGNRFEASVLEYVSDELGKKLTRNQFRVRAGTNIGANIDALTEDNEPVEVKLVGMRQETFWGEDDGAQSVPVHHAIQNMTQMVCVGAERGFVGALFGSSFEARVFVLPYSPVIGEHILEVCDNFTRLYIERDTPPPTNEASRPTMQVLKHFNRVLGKGAEVSRETILRYRDLRNARIASEKAEQAALSEIVGALTAIQGGLADHATIDGRVVFTFLEVNATKKVYAPDAQFTTVAAPYRKPQLKEKEIEALCEMK